MGKETDKRIMKNSEAMIKTTLEDIQTELDKINSMVINTQAFFYHFKHAKERLENKKP